MGHGFCCTVLVRECSPRQCRKSRVGKIMLSSHTPAITAGQIKKEEAVVANMVKCDLQMQKTETCGASVQNVHCTKAGTAGGRNIQSKVNIWQIGVSIWVSHLQTFWSQQRSSQFGQGVLRHSLDVSQNRPNESWCESDYFLFWGQRSLHSAVRFVRMDSCFLYISFILVESWFFLLSWPLDSSMQCDSTVLMFLRTSVILFQPLLNCLKSPYCGETQVSVIEKNK